MPREGARRDTRCENPNHKHGIYCYKKCCCSCDVCGAANSAHAARQRRNAAYGRHPVRHPVEPVIERLVLLRKDGWTMREIADATGMNKSSLQRMLRQPGRWVTAETTQRILGVHSLQKRTTAFVDATGTRRRIQGLAAQGWTLTALGQRIGKDAQQMWSWTHANLVTVAIHELIKELYDELEVAPPPEGPYAVRARRMAVKHGWVPGLCWDDIDDPRERPKGLPKAA